MVAPNQSCDRVNEFGTAHVGSYLSMLQLLNTISVVLAMTPVGFEPTQIALVELESTPLDHSGKVSTDGNLTM